MNSEVFKPVRGTEASILSKTPTKGYLFFATDTRKIYYGDGESFLPMGGNTGVWYGRMQYAETPDDSQVEFYFSFTDLEGNTEDEYSLPNVDDLIFNTPDGCFYRVVEIGESDIKCNRLTVAGSGGGSGGGGGSNVGLMSLIRLGDATINTLFGNPCYIRFNFSATDAAGEPTGQGTASIYVQNTLREVTQINQGDNALDISKYLETETTSIRLTVSGDVGGTSNITQSKTWTIIASNLAIAWDYDETTINEDENITFKWTVSTSLAHTIHIDIDGFEDAITRSYLAGSSRDKVYIASRLDVGLNHGSHTVTMYATAEIGGKTFTSAPVTHKMICVDEGYSNTIISVGNIITEMEQYDTLSIPLIFYNPISSNGLVSAILFEDGVEKDRWTNYTNGAQYYWNYTPTTSGAKILTVTSGTSEAVIRITVNDLGLNIEEVDGYEFKFKASDIISNNALKSWSQGSIVPTFSENFDWTNGGLQTELDNSGNIRNYVCVKAGNRLSFNYKPFNRQNPAVLANGFCIKIIFKSTECRSYDANILSIGDSASDAIYFQLKANEGTYQAAGASVTIPYCEDSYIELEIDLWPYGNGSSAYLMSWLDGVPSTVSTYSNSSTFKQTNPADIVIGSDDCDVQIYMIKVYQSHLTNEQHLNNFIMDAPNAIEVINRYNRNNILDSNGEISYSKLIEKNPDCDVYLYEMDHMTTHKKDDKVKNCTYRRYHGSTIPLQTAEGVTMSVQGTSSAAYGVAAFNFDSDFTQGFTDYSKNTAGEHIDKWSMTETSIPVSYFNTKVNVASCEGANNALNQEWYDRYVPYVTEYHAKNKDSGYSPRNTMEFPRMGVVFLKDNNQTSDKTGTEAVKNNVFKEIPGYLSNPFYKMYAICNMGNSKKNTEVFSDLNNPYDVIMENSDNNSVYQQMTGVLTQDENSLRGIWDGDKFFPTDENGVKAQVEVFEWRSLPTKKWAAIQEASGVDMRELAQAAWLGLVAWFARNNPDAATGALLPEAETYEPYTFVGYTSGPRPYYTNSSGIEMPSYTPELQILKGSTITEYAGTYTNDTYQRRMAKMLSECEEHLIMDEMIFHYLFIERHSLVDNVAKNTFWHTEDLQHWSMIKDYDNDTSDGNDNSGYLTLTYGYEVLDHINHDSTQNMVFNAPNSVWLHFIDGLLDARTTMYRYLDNIVTDRDETSIHGAWKAQPYLDKFNAWQSCLPERVWIEDYYRKYLRPYEVYKTDNYLERLAGGKKTHQRKQYEIYQQNYMSSEYFGSETSSSLIDIRANGSNIAEKVFPMTMYADSYIRVAAGSGHSPNVRVRARRGETYNITLPVSGGANDMTTYFFLASYITSLKNLEYLKPKTLDISAAYRLKEFSMKSIGASDYYVLTSDTELDNSKTYYRGKYDLVASPVEEDFDTYYLADGTGYINAAINGYSFNPESFTYFTFDGYEEVEEPSISEIGNYYELITSSSNLNLTRASFINNRMLEKLELIDCPNVKNDLNLSTATNLKYLDVQGSGFPIIIIANNAPVETMKLNDPQTLTFNNLSNISTFSIGDDNLAILNLNNIDDSPGVNSKDLAEMVTNWISCNLQNVQWTINDSSELSTENEEYHINILDTLLNVSGGRNTSGTLTITGNAYNSSDSLEFYNKYSIDPDYLFPNLNLEFTGSNAKLYEVIIKNGNEEIIWKRKTIGGFTITNDFLSAGQLGSFFRENIDPTAKSSTESRVFTFANSWTLTDLDNNTSIIINGSTPLYETSLNANVLIIPNFNESIRQYEIKFIDGDGREFSSNSYDYGTLIKDILPSAVPTKDDSELDIYKTYTFLGYALSPTASMPVAMTEDRVVNNTYTYYAIFSKETSVKSHDNVNYDNFRFQELLRGYTDDDDRFAFARSCSVTPAVGKQLAGKITIPAYSPDGLPVSMLGDFRGQTNITGIFFEEIEDSEIKTNIRMIGSNACQNLTKLKYFDFPDGLRSIEANAFVECRLRLIPEGSKATTSYVLGGENLYSLGTNAFNNSIDDNCEVLYLTPGITTMGAGALSYFNEARNLKQIIIGTPEKASLLQYNSSTKPIVFNTDSPPLYQGNDENENKGIIFYTSSSVDETSLKQWLNPYGSTAWNGALIIRKS